jgi:2-polyprenyl-3-methyl-5-hydroxy-6-metoxy-1,4-benzoquinol methylase
MRDKGFDFYRQDVYCKNLFAKSFDISDIKMDGKFELLTAFEVFEHLTNPNEELKKMLQLSDNIFFSTELVPKGVVNKDDWWYFIPETGQHIALHTVSSLKHLAKQHNLNFYSNGKNLHLLTKKKLKAKAFKLLMNFRIAKVVDILKRRSKTLLHKDYQAILQQIHQD